LVFVVPPWRPGGDSLYHGLRRSDATSKHINVTTTSVAMIYALGLVVITPQPTKYHHYGTAFFRDFF
jgi:hypothetical protein